SCDIPNLELHSENRTIDGRNLDILDRKLRAYCCVVVSAEESMGETSDYGGFANGALSQDNDLEQVVISGTHL
ncbi:MAG: hypothetical protein RTU92_13955, partial [Candidatus Thorarchaeota archaeon]